MEDLKPNSAAAAANVTAKSTHKRSVWRWIARVALGVVAVLLIAYATLPYWLPTDWLARRLEERLSFDLNRQVRIGEIRVGWRQGISIENVTVAGLSGRPDELLARVRRIGCGFTPVFTLRTGRLDHLDIIDPEIWLTFDEDGQLTSLRDLGRRSAGDSGFPTWHYHIQRASCHLQMPNLLQTFRIDDLTCSIDKPAGILSVSGKTAIPRNDSALSPGETTTARLLVEGSVVAPQLRKDVVLHGQARVEWQGLAVTDLPMLIATKIPIEQVDGVTTGQLGFSVQSDLRAEYDLLIRFNSVRVLRRDSERPYQLPDASLSCKGLWDPVRDLLTMDELDFQTQAIGVRGSGTRQRPALLIDPAGEAPLVVRLAGKVKNWGALCGEFPEVDEWTRSTGVRIDGGADLSVDYTRHPDDDHLVARVESRNLRCGIGPLSSEALHFDPDVPKTLRVDISRNPATGRYVQREMSLSVGGTAFTCRGEMTVPGPEVVNEWDRLTSVFPMLQYQVVARIADVGELARVLPAHQGKPPFIQGQGPAELKCSLTPQEDRSRLAISIDLPADTEVHLGPGLFNKPAGRALSFSAGVAIPHQLIGDLNDLALDLSYGPATLHLVADESRAGLDAAFSSQTPPDPAATAPVVRANWKLPIKVKKIEDLAGLFPRLLAMIGSDQPDLRGDAGLTVEGKFISGAGDWLIRNQGKLNMAGLAARYAGVVEKPADRPLDLTFSHQCQSQHGRCEQSLYASVDQPGGQVSGSLVFSQGSKEASAGDFEAMTVRANLKDVDRFVALVPPLRGLLASGRGHPVGGLTLEFQSLLLDGRLTASLATDATAAGFTLAGDTEIDKPPGVPARLRLEWEEDPVPGTTGDRRWHVTGGSVQLGGLSATGLTGLLLMEPDSPLLPRTRGGGEAIAPRKHAPRLKAVALQADGQLDLDDPFWQRRLAFENWRDKVNLSGDVKWHMEAGCDDGLFSFKGRLDARAAGLICDLGHRILPVVVKPPGTPAVVTLDLTALHPRGSSDMRVEARGIEVDLDGNDVRLSGLARMEADKDGIWRPDHVVADTQIHLTNPTALSDLTPGFSFRMLDGAAHGRLSATIDRERIETTGEAGFDKVLIAAGSDPIGLDGRISFDKDRILLDQLHCSWGDSQGTVAGAIHTVPGGRTGRALLGMAVERFDQPQLEELLAQLPLSSPAETRPEGDVRQIKRRIVDILRRLDLDLDLRVNQATATLPMDVRVNAEAAVNRVTVKDGYVNMDFGAVVDGGFISGSFMTDLQRSEPTIYLNYTASRIQPGPLVDRYLFLTFPGMKATGPLTIIDETYQKLSPAPGEDNYEVGDGELMIEGGTVEGRAAPRWMTRVFPRLDLASFEFTYMHSWFKKLEDGRIRHQMIFRGRFYNIYMVGESKTGGQMKYEVGIDFLADFDSHYWAESGQGRVPLFTKTGRIKPTGGLEDEEVVYVPQQFILSLLVKNNPLVTAYYAVRKRVSGEQ